MRQLDFYRIKQYIFYFFVTLILVVMLIGDTTLSQDGPPFNDVVDGAPWVYDTFSPYFNYETSIECAIDDGFVYRVTADVNPIYFEVYYYNLSTKIWIGLENTYHLDAHGVTYISVPYEHKYAAFPVQENGQLVLHNGMTNNVLPFMGPYQNCNIDIISRLYTFSETPVAGTVDCIDVNFPQYAGLGYTVTWDGIIVTSGIVSDYGDVSFVITPDNYEATQYILTVGGNNYVINQSTTSEYQMPICGI